MKKLLPYALVGIALACTAAHAEDKARTPQQNKMAMCNKEAVGKAGDERKAFMKTCLSASNDAQQARAKTCNTEAGSRKGEERKAFVGECLKKS